MTRELCALVVTMAICGTAVAKVTGPAIVQAEGAYTLVLPPATAAAIQAAVPGFQPETLASYDADIQQGYSFTCRQAPWAVVGDFDGDGVQDVIVQGQAAGRGYQLCVWGATAAVDTISVEHHKWERPLSSVLMYAAPGKQYTNFSDDSLFIWADGYQNYIFEKAGDLLYWKDGHWNSWQNSD